MRKISLIKDVVPHVIAVAVFFFVTLFFFNPVFFDNKKIAQHDIEEWEGSSKALRDYRNETGEEGLWAPTMFSGMPAYLINVEWGNEPVAYMKRILSLSLPHPVANIYLAFICYYILLLSFGVRPYLAIGGAIAFGLSTYMIVGISAGHNARIGAIAFMPLVMAGIHLVFSGKKFLGFGVTTAGFAMHLRENHLQITYYLAFIVLVYGLIQLIYYFREREIITWAKNVGILVPAVLIAVGTFVGPLWAVTEYTAYSIRGKSELHAANSPSTASESGPGKEWAFEFSNGLLEPMTLLVPNFYGGSSQMSLIRDGQSATVKALRNSGDENLVNQLVNYSSAYWGPQRLAVPYYAGAIVVFLFIVGIGFADKKWVWWLVPVAFFGIVLSWGKNFETFNHFLFDHFPGYNKFRSVTFALIISLFAFPLLGALGLEKIWANGLGKEGKKKLLILGGVTAGICVLSWLFAGMLSFTRDVEAELPSWFVNAMAEDRRSLLVGDVFRSLGFIIAIFVILYFEVHKKMSPVAVYAFLIVMITIDLSVVNKRYFTEDNFKRKRDNTTIAMTDADGEILKDKSYYRVFNLGNSIGSAFNEARTSYYHNSIGGYHGAKLKRYQDLLDSCLYTEIGEFVQNIQSGNPEFEKLGIFNMLNTKYMVFGTDRAAFVRNTAANGSAWFVRNVVEAKSPAEELKMTGTIDTRTTAVIDGSKFALVKGTTDSLAKIDMIEHRPNYLKYESNSSTDGLAVFSEIYYEKGWKGFIDNKETPITRANYILRALPVSAGKHTIEFKFEPAAYTIGNPITIVTSWLMLVVLLGSIGLTYVKQNGDES
jgi:hypothetical protein